MTLLASPSWVVATGALALCFLVWSWRVESRVGLDARQARRRWRRLALVAVAGSLFLLAARPAVERPVAAGGALLVTAGADQPIAPEEAAEIFALPGAPSDAGSVAPDLAALVRRRPDLRRWQVVGWGLEAWQAEALPGVVAFRAAAIPGPGIDRAQWRRRLSLGERLEVRGSLTGRGGTLRLRGPGGVEAEAEIEPGGSFALGATPRQSGRFLYRLELGEGAEPSRVETVAVEVTARRLPRLLWLAGAPSFESREVKTWLRDVGGSLVVRSQLSRGRFLYEYLNHRRIEVARLDPQQLADFDLVVADGVAWRALAASERRMIDEAVRAGLGLLLLPGPADFPRPAGDAAPVFEVAAVGDLGTMEVAVRGRGTGPLAPLVVPARQFVLGPGQRPLFRDGAGRPLVVDAAHGLGRVAATVLEDSYRWVLRGDGAAHRRYWSALLAAAARRPEVGPVSAPAGPILVDRPLELTRVATAAESLRMVAPDGGETRLVFAQDPLEPRRWSVVWWPRQPGWHRLLDGDDESWWHAAGGGEWLAWQRRQAQEATRRRAALGPATASSSPAVALREWPRWPFFALLLTAWAALWADDHWRRGAGAA